MYTQKPQSFKEVLIPGLAESWVELAPSRASLCSSVEAVMVDRDAGDLMGGAASQKDSRLRYFLLMFSVSVVEYYYTCNPFIDCFPINSLIFLVL
jgi:hypothetical protein